MAQENEGKYPKATVDEILRRGSSKRALVKPWWSLSGVSKYGSS